MKKMILVAAVFLLFSALPARAEERITDYTVEIKISRDASLAILEKITYDFDESERHGLYREIPYKYKARGGAYALRLSDFSVADGSGTALPFKESRADGRQILKIGDPDKTISGQQTYIIGYKVRRAINFFPGHDELYWNAVGGGWEVPIEQARVDIFLPESIREADLKTECFAGGPESGRNCLSRRYSYSGQNLVSDIVLINDRLDPGEGLTAVIGWTKGVVAKPSFFERAADFSRDNYIVILPFLAGALMYLLWRKKGRDPLGRRTIIAEYTPLPGLSPSEIGTIIDERANKHDVSADIVYLAVLGFLKIKKIESPGKILKNSDYELVKIKEPDSHLPGHCQLLFRSIFKNRSAVKLSGLKDRFHHEFAQIIKAIYRSTVDKGYFKASPQKIRGRYAGAGIACLVLSWFLGPIFGPVGVISLAASAAIVIVFGFFMPARTEKGVLAKEHILGLKKYFQVAEKDRLKFHNAPEKNPRHFEALLPFAMALSVEKAWARQFAGIYNQAPAWYEDPARGAFNALVLADSLSGFNRDANAAISAKPSSAAGGRSGFSGGGAGGGFGGGGGRSW